MLRIVDGQAFFGEKAKDEWHLRQYDLGNGHVETVISRPTVWVECELTPATLELLAERETEEAIAERKAANLKRAARRAKTTVRRRIKVLGLDSMLTLTYRGNQRDLALCKRHFELFRKRMGRAIPGWKYVAAFEPQDRGAWHVHIATHRLPFLMRDGGGQRVKSYGVIRAMWRAVTGEWGGNIDQSARKRRSKWSTGKLAAYLSKYMLKAFEDGDEWQNRYQGSQCGPLPEPVLLRFRGEQLAHLIELAYCDAQGAHRECSAFLSRYGDVFYLSSEGPPPSFDSSTHCR